MRPGRGVERDGDAALAGDRPQRIGDLAGERHDVDPLRRRHVDAQLDAGERQEVVDQPRHAQGLHPHDAEEALPRLGVVPGRALQGLDEAEQRGEGRAQLVAGIGDEIDPHRLEALGRGEVAQEQHDVRPGPPGLAALHRADLHLEGALGRHPRGIERLQRLAGAQDDLDPVEHVGVAQREGEGVARAQGRQERAGGGVRFDHQGAAVDQDDRIGMLASNASARPWRPRLPARRSAVPARPGAARRRDRRPGGRGVPEPGAEIEPVQPGMPGQERPARPRARPATPPGGRPEGARGAGQDRRRSGVGRPVLRRIAGIRAWRRSRRHHRRAPPAG